MNLRRQVKHRASNKKHVRRSRADGPDRAIPAKSPMDDAIMFNENTKQTDGVIFGVYGADDWVTASHMKQAVQEGKTTLAMEGTWITEAGWKLHEWVMRFSDRFNFFSHQRAIVFFDWGLVEATVSRGKLELSLSGDPAQVIALIALVDTELKRAENLIEWVYSARGDSISVPLNYRPAIKSAYPWLPKDIFGYIDDYLNSAASVIILIGPPGTGKTTFIKNLIHRSGGDAKVTYDEKVMSDDSLFAGFIEGDTRFLVMEDADAFLSAREDGNTMMHRFLNVSDGLISAEGKKLVFSTNLPSVRDIDAALLRPGRCFDIVEFRPLTRDEAQEVALEVGTCGSLPDGKEFTLAEIFNVQPSGDTQATRRVGFV